MALDDISRFGEPGFSPLVDAGNEILLPEIQRRLANWGLVNSDLRNSVKIEVKGNTLSIVMAPYGKYVNYGVGGNTYGSSLPDQDGRVHRYGSKMPPPSVFGVYTSDKSHQFAIAKKIQKFGIKARPFIPDTQDQIWSALNDRVAELLTEGLEDLLPAKIEIRYDTN